MRKMILSVFATVVALTANAQVVTASLYPYDECAEETEVRDAEYSPTEETVSLQQALSFYYTGFFHRPRYMDYSSHDHFGKRSIDLMSDMWSGDVAMQASTYGWFDSDEQANLFYRRNSIWFLYYRWLYAVNKAIVNYPSAETNEPTAYAELLAIRGYIYSCLASLYGSRTDNANCCPIYTEDNYQVRFTQINTREQVYTQAITDLENALTIMEAHQFDSEDKLEIDRDIVHGLLAHIYLNAAVGSATHENAYLQQALSHAITVINSTTYPILPYNDLLTNGFNNVESANWIWGRDVDSLNTGALKSFFGHVDIYTYSYAGAGDYKMIDYNLYLSIPTWDARKEWFVSTNYQYALAPYRKFFSGEENPGIMADRKWLSDDVFMRIEALYLIAAEASWRLGDVANAKNYLCAVTDKRYNTENETNYNTWKASLMTADAVKQQIIYNWRVEMWGEGYAYETMRRWNHARTRGANHADKPNVTITANDIATNYSMPFPYVTDSTGNYILDNNNHAILSATGEEVTITFYIYGCEEPQGLYTCMAGDIVEFYVPGEDPQPILWEVISENKTDSVQGTFFTQWVPKDLTVIAHSLEDSTPIPTIQIRPADTQKYFRNGQILIIREDKTYTLQGQEVR